MKKLIGIAGIIVLSGCASRFTIETKVMNPVESKQVESSITIRGGTNGQSVALYQKVMKFLNDEYFKK